MKFGLGQFTLQRPPWDTRSFSEIYDEFLRVAVLAEELGFDSIWLAEHHGSWDGYGPSLLPTLSAVASRTERIRLGTAVILAPFHDPLRLAEDAAVVDLISKGRLTLGLGLGWAPEEYKMFGADRKTRGRRLSETVEILRLAWSEDMFSYSGRVLSYDDVSVTPRPERSIPIFLGGSEPAAIARAARMGDGHFPARGGLEQAIDRARRIVEIRREEGIDGPYGYGMFVPAGLGATPEDAWATIRDGVLHTSGAYLVWASEGRDLADARDVGAAALEEKMQAGALVGTPEQIVERLRPVVAEIDGMGLHEPFISVILSPAGMPYDDAAGRMRTYAERVIAPLRG